MYKTSYVCDCCGAEMTLPMYTLNLSTQSLCVQDQTSWHYCNDCWKYIKKSLIKKNELNDLEKTIEELREENKKLKKDASWYQDFWLAMFEAAVKNKEKCTYSSPYYTSCTSDGKPYTAGYCCENTNKDSLDYKQTTGI